MRSLRSILIWLGVGIFLYGILNINRTNAPEYPNIRFSDFVEDVNMKRIKDVVIYPSDASVIATYGNNQKISTNFTYHDQFFIKRLLDNRVGIKINYGDDRSYSFWMAMISSWLPNILLFILILYSNMSGGGKGAFGFGKSKAKLVGDKTKKVTFNDVAGLPEAKDELYEIVTFLKDPLPFVRVGAKIPKGVLLYGPPGTGKTLLARAIAGEANVPFLYMSGAEFVEMFVGVGASRVRDLFAQAKKIGRCIIFIDELDSIGKKRNMFSLNDERETTLNQFLVELDGFDTNSGIIVIGATNRPDVLDPALLRPGRFDRLISVPLPDAKGREEILKVHLSKVKVDPEEGIDLQHVIHATTGMSGAQLSNIVNEAAIIAGRDNREFITTKDLINAMENAILGSKTSLVMQEKDRELTAYHESGHAVISLFVENADPIFKATIIPTGKALGMVISLPEYEEVSVSKAKLLDQICVLMGGGLGEEIRYGADYLTSGASHDIEVATNIATNMVSKWGMSKVIGKVHYALDGDNNAMRPSEEMLQKIYDERQKIIDEQYDRAKSILIDKYEIWDGIAKLLLELETVTGDQLRYFAKNKTLEGYEPSKREGKVYRGIINPPVEINYEDDED